MSVVVAFLGLFAMAQVTEPAFRDDVPTPDLTESLSAPPAQSVHRSKCSCPAERVKGVIILEGVVVDAEMTLAADGLSPADRQATIFNIKRSSDHGMKGRTKIRHSTIRDQCGVSFDYGRKYKIAVQVIEDTIETDECLMRQAEPLGTITAQ